MKGAFLDVALWLILAALVVLVITNSKGFVADISTLGGTTDNTLLILSGQAGKAK